MASTEVASTMDILESIINDQNGVVCFDTSLVMFEEMHIHGKVRLVSVNCNDIVSRDQLSKAIHEAMQIEHSRLDDAPFLSQLYPYKWGEQDLKTIAVFRDCDELFIKLSDDEYDQLQLDFGSLTDAWSEEDPLSQKEHNTGLLLIFPSQEENVFDFFSD